MARPLRIEYEGAFYHVTSRGNKKKEIFRNQSENTRGAAGGQDVVEC